MGASGCGKTTLIEVLVGLKQLDRGSVSLFGEAVGKHNEKIGYMPQSTALIHEFSISETVHFFGKIYGMKKIEIDERLDFLQKLLELPDIDQIVGTCSGGQQRRISFAIALVHDPEILILDEPTVGVDPLLRTRIWDFLIDLTKKKNTTVLITTHYIEEAKQSTHVGLMRKGLLVAEDTPYNLLTKFNTDSLEEAFLKLSEQQEIDIKSFGKPSRKYARLDSNQSTLTRRVRNAGVVNKNKLRALVDKNTTQLIRNPG
jgi:ABC-type multidrug transport system ATPase subunit